MNGRTSLPIRRCPPRCPTGVGRGVAMGWLGGGTLLRMGPMRTATSHWLRFCGALLLAAATASGAVGQAGLGAADSKPYDDRLMRLSEILGAVHYLRELCGANDGQAWR